MKAKGVIRAVRQSGLRNFVRLRLFSIENGREVPVATSALVNKVGAAAICRLFDGPYPVRPDVGSLEEIFRAPGKTAWAGFAARDPRTAAEVACAQHDIHRAKGVLLIVTLSPASNIVDDMRAVLDVVHRQAADSILSVLVSYDETLQDQTRVEVLLTGLY